MTKRCIILLSFVLAVSLAGTAWAGLQQDIEMLGGFLYKDKKLSLNRNQSCMTCHHPSAGFADPENLREPVVFPVSDGSDPTLFGGRNAPTSAYAGFSPVFHYDSDIGGYVGGMFWDGRATGAMLGDPLAEQALGPFLNPVEMAMTKEAVVAAVSTSNYAGLFMKVFPDTVFSNVEITYNNIGRAIAAFERSNAVTRFSSKFDAFYAACQKKKIDVSTIDTTTNLATLPTGILTTAQLKGLALFNDPSKGNCAACHSTAAFQGQEGNVFPPLFTDFTYDNLGIPTNDIAVALSEIAPPDLGLGSLTGDPLQNGKFKVPTLRNAAKTAPYGHNGYFPTLEEIVHFYNTRDVEDENWDDPEVPENMNTMELGNLGLTPQEEFQIVAFMKTLTDQQ